MVVFFIKYLRTLGFDVTNKEMENRTLEEKADMENLKADVVEMFTAKTAGLPGKAARISVKLTADRVETLIVVGRSAAERVETMAFPLPAVLVDRIAHGRNDIDERGLQELDRA